MSVKCDVCGKHPVAGNTVSHSNRKSKRTWNPNLQRIRVVQDGAVKTIKICTRCLRSNKVQKVV